MDDQYLGDDILIATTNSERGILRRVAVLIVINAIAIAMNLLVIFSPQTNADVGVVLLLLGDGLVLGLSLFIVAIDSRGTWTLDKLGIEHRRPIRPVVSLRWSDVSRIMWFDSLVALEGKGVRIRVRLDLLGRHEREQVKALIESRLQGQFDLGPSPILLDRRGLTRCYLQRTAVGGLMAAIFIGVFVALTIYPFQREANRTVAVLAWTPLGLIGCMAPLGIMIGVQNARINPHYPWRRRLSGEYSKPKLPNFGDDLA